MKIEDLEVESFVTSSDEEVSFMPEETWNDATAGCCSPPPFTASPSCTCAWTCL